MVEIRGGARFERAMAELTAGLTNAATLRVGFFANARYPDATSVAMVAAINNYGAPRAGILPRPFFSNMVADKSKEWPGGIAAALQASDNNADAALRVVGAAVRGQLQQSIRDTNAPPLAPATIARKGFSKPLIDTELMLNSAAYEVK